MDEKRLQKRYAQSLFDLAKQRDIINTVFDDVNNILDVCNDNRELNTVLKNPTIKPLKKREILFALFENKCDELTMRFLSLITSKRREIYLKEICTAFIETFNAYNNIKVVKVTSAAKLSEETLNTIKQKIETAFSCKVQTEEYINTNLIGGFILETDGKQYDASYLRKLNDLRKEITK
ncbi:MAG: ATP synthase F1 subunit delta [Bacteroidales bacterium]|nr:ATP synthase F1 subunit delta [Bacteroidales bacterium]